MSALARIVGLDKPARRGPKPRKPLPRAKARIKRSVPVKKRSDKRAAVEKADRLWSSKVKERQVAIDEWGLCQCRCGLVGAVAHHLWPKGTYVRLRHDIENGAWLTEACHRRVHRVIGLEAFRRWLLPEDVFARLDAKATREARMS